MRTTLLSTTAAIALAAAAQPLPLTSNDWVIGPGTEVYDTAAGPVRVDNLLIRPGGTLRIVGAAPFLVTASDSIVIHGVLDLGGEGSSGVTTLNTTNQPEQGAAGNAAGGAGGVGSSLATQSTPKGGDGFGPIGVVAGGGQGGESGFGLPSLDDRRPGGGGGGVLGPDAPEHPDLSDPSNIGLIAQDGVDGGATATGAVSQSSPPLGGSAGLSPFQDGDPANDFWGAQLNFLTGMITIGELDRPIAGQGGGAGGDAVQSSSFPSVPFLASGDEKGAGGGGGGGLGVLVARRITVFGLGRILADGGSGGGGENTIFFNRVGGGSGGGSGGFLILEAKTIDLSGANPGTISARGGQGGRGRNNVFGATCGGGNGGPGLIQLHVANPSDILLGTGMQLSDITVPDAYMLLPVFTN